MLLTKQAVTNAINLPVASPTACNNSVADYESDPEHDDACGWRHFGAVGKSVKESEETHDQDGGAYSHLRFFHDQRRENRHRDENGQFDARQRHASGPDNAANRHDANKHCRNKPDRAPSLLGRPPSDGDHHYQMIPTVQRMIESVTPAVHSHSRRVSVGQ